MKELTIKLPNSVDVTNQQLAFIVAGLLYGNGKLSLGQAAEVAGLSKKTFTELIGKNNISIFNFPPFDLSKDIANA